MKLTKRYYCLILTVIAVLFFYAFTGIRETQTIPKQYEIFKRIPAGNFLLFSAAPKSFFDSEFMLLMSNIALGSSDSTLEEIETKSGEVEAMIGINPMDIERITVFGGEPKRIGDELGAIIQVNAENFYYDLLLSKFEVVQSTLLLSGYNVQMFSEGLIGSGEEIYLFHDDIEIVITTSKNMMEKTLGLKRGNGPSLADDRDFINRMYDLKYNESLWIHLPTDKIIEDVLGKVSTKKPDILGDNFEFSSLLCGISLSSDFRLNVKIYSANEEQLTLIYDLFNGLKAVGMLSLTEYPEARKILNVFEFKKENDYFDIDVKITKDDVELLLGIGKGINNKSRYK